MTPADANPFDNPMGGTASGAGETGSGGAGAPSAFDNFFEESYDQALDTKYLTAPKGDFVALISKLTPRVVQTKNGPGTVLDVLYDVIDGADEKAKATIAKLRDGGQLPPDKNLQVRDGFFLELENGRIVMSPQKNVKLGMVRSAVNQNEPGKPWALKMLEGAGPLYIRVDHQDNPTDKDNPYARVVRWAPVRKVSTITGSAPTAA